MIAECKHCQSASWTNTDSNSDNEEEEKEQQEK